MVCNPSDNNINIPIPGPSTQIPGIGLPFSIPKIPFPDISIPPGLPEDLIALMDRLFALLPNGVRFDVATDSMTKGVWDALASLFNKLAPYLGLYNFFQALLNVILCIIDVFCALLNPWATLRAIRRLFKRCLPDFLALFPWIALLIMILALILLLIALIEYMISVIEAYIKQIIANLKILARAMQVKDEKAILNAIQKLAYLLCLIEQLFSLLMGIASLLAIIKPLMSIGGRTVCSNGSGGGTASDCCTEDFCPGFISNNPDGLLSATGHLIYQSKIQPFLPADPLFDFMRNADLTIRPERWQFVDDSPGRYSFLNIITPSPGFGFIYWPNNDTFDNKANLVYVPYILDITLTIDPRNFGNPSDIGGKRSMNIRNITVSQKPTVYPLSWNNGVELQVASGSVSLVGGEVFEFDKTSIDGYSPYLINGTQATLETLITRPIESSNSFPAFDDGYNFTDVQYNLKYNHEVLIGDKLIGLMCQPDTAAEAAVVNAEFSDLRSVLDKVGDLPDVDGTITCLRNSLTTFRSNLNAETAAVFQSDMSNCLNSLKDNCIDFYCRGTAATADRFKSDIGVSPELQFINHDIQVSVTLRDKTGTQLAVGVSSEIAACLGGIIKANATLGKVSDFVYDGYGSFVAALSSDKAGKGEITGLINNETIANIINRDNDNLPSEIVDRTVSYEFIDKTSYTYRRDQGDEYVNRFDETDIAEDGT